MATWSGKRSRKKLQINERVEVRSIEGSWHPGRVINCGDLKRCVRYDKMLAKDGLSFVVEEVNVSNALDGGVVTSPNCSNYRGPIRPLPPLVGFEKCDLKFGLCVDVQYHEEWREGVILDHCDGMEEERSVFFPVLGDEMKKGIREMRISQDWDEVSDKWRKRGNWVFLELIEECMKECYFGVSIQEIWYHVRAKKEFAMIGSDWTLGVKELWRKMVMEVLDDYSQSEQKELTTLTLPEIDYYLESQPTTLPEIHYCPEAQPTTLLETDYCPEAVMQYALASKKSVRTAWTQKVRKHLECLGWKVECQRNKSGAKPFKYKPPNEGDEDKKKKKVYYSLIEVCKVVQKENNMNSSMSQIDRCHDPNALLNPSDMIMDLDSSPLVVVESSGAAVVAVVDEQPYCPQAVVEYYASHILLKNQVHKKRWILKAKNHLLTDGWNFDHPPPDKRRRVIYISPQNRRFYTLHAACRFCIEQSISRWTVSGRLTFNVSTINNEEDVDKVSSDDLLHRVAQTLPRI